ncbi:glycosyltransferase family 2 protein [Geomonas sp. RF6]|uniref:glycosyltransferase family 2 protein n=1 Tax=Geomonas sp. RF6 TaxID=2897342 RepID=UPI001E4D3718|nr:glycosyltransferase family 2 protein [Geomonas sp. RF6]UFS71303.1 glycosyltransferase family 2 protein [Geomonas sp. RF6]
MPGEAPAISVCMATCNGERFVRQQLDSILPQLGPHDEVIVSDDSSTDSTVALVRSMADPRIVLLNGSFRSPVRNFENALGAARGERIFLADQDDLWHPGKVAALMPLLERFNLVVSDCNLIDENGREIAPSFFAMRGSGPGVVKNVLKNGYLGCCMAFRRSVLDMALPFPETIPMHDMWLGIVAEMAGRTHFLRNPLVCYRRHGANASPTGEKSSYTVLQKIRFRYRLICALVGRVRSHE